MTMLAIQIELPLSKSLLNRAMIAIAGQGNLKTWLEKIHTLLPMVVETRNC